MNKIVCTFKHNWLPCLKFFLIGSLCACHTFSKNQDALRDQSFVLKWSYQSATQKVRPVTSYVYMRGEQWLRVDFMIPIRGTIGRFVLNHDQMMVQLPLKKEFYEGTFNSQILLPEFDRLSLSSLWALLKAKPLKDWKCVSSANQQVCQTESFVVKWVFKNSYWVTAQITSAKKDKLRLKKIRILNKSFDQSIFSLSNPDYQKKNHLSLK